MTSGFNHFGVPHIKFDLFVHILPELPAVVIILVIEHIAIAKAMGRLYNYTINPSQEIVALGVANMMSPFVGGYVCTGSFGASAVLSKAGVRTPLAGLFSALVVALSLLALTKAFYFIPKAALAGLIVHAVYTLLARPKNLHRYWQLSPIEALVWIACVLLAIFKPLEVAIYVGVLLSLMLMLVQLARSRGRFIGRVRSRRVVGGFGSRRKQAPRASDASEVELEAFLPLERSDASNPNIIVETPYPGVFIYRFNENYNYTNQAHHVDAIISHVTKHSTRMSEEHFEKESDRLWNDPGPTSSVLRPKAPPFLRAVILDFAAVNNLDITSVQGLVDLRNTLDRYAAPDAVEWHFAHIHNRWTRRALAIAGFGYPTSRNPEALGHWQPLYSIAMTATDDAPAIQDRQQVSGSRYTDEEQPSDDVFPETVNTQPLGREATTLSGSTIPETPSLYVNDEEPDAAMAAVLGVDRPFFHLDRHEAVRSAVWDAKNKDASLT